MHLDFSGFSAWGSIGQLGPGSTSCGGQWHVQAASGKTFLVDVVDPGSVMRTDGWPSCSRLQALGYRYGTSVTGRDPNRSVLPAGSSSECCCSSAGWWKLTKALRGISTWTTTSTNSLSGSTAGHHSPAACCSTGCLSKRLPPPRGRARR